MSEFLEPIGPYKLAKPYGSYIWMVEQPSVVQLTWYVRSGVWPEVHKKLKAEGLCTNYGLTPKGRALLNQNRS